MAHPRGSSSTLALCPRAITMAPIYVRMVAAPVSVRSFARYVNWLQGLISSTGADSAFVSRISSRLGEGPGGPVYGYAINLQYERQDQGRLGMAPAPRHGAAAKSSGRRVGSNSKPQCRLRFLRQIWCGIRRSSRRKQYTYIKVLPGSGGSVVTFTFSSIFSPQLVNQSFIIAVCNSLEQLKNRF
jgi:hypothetical protein